MKQEIMEKVINNQELTSEEIIYLGRNLPTTSHLPYDHTKPSSMEACGIDIKNVENVNKVFAELVNGRVLNLSQTVEEVEKLVLADERYLRMVIVQCIRFSELEQSPIGKLLGIFTNPPKPKEE